jgi:hypothetical protein
MENDSLIKVAILVVGNKILKHCPSDAQSLLSLKGDSRSNKGEFLNLLSSLELNKLFKKWN